MSNADSKETEFFSRIVERTAFDVRPWGHEAGQCLAHSRKGSKSSTGIKVKDKVK